LQLSLQRLFTGGIVKKNNLTMLKIFIIGIATIAAIFAASWILFTYNYPNYTGPMNTLQERVTEIYPNQFYLVEITRYPASGFIEQASPDGNVTIGFNISLGSISFGSVFPKGTSRRVIGINPRDNVLRKAEIRAYGNISEMIRFSDSSFTFNSSREISAIFSPESGEGLKTGEIDVIIISSKNDFSRWLLGY
jgi:hypothetical protein